MSIVNSFGSGGGAISSVTNGANDRIAVFSSSDSIGGGTGLTYTGSEFAVTGDISSTGNYYGSQFFYHTGDTDTSMKFTVDQINLTAGNINMLKIKEAAQDEVVWFEDGNDVDFRIEVPGQAYFFWIDSGNDKLYLGGNTANKLTSEMVNVQDGNFALGKNSNDNTGSELHFVKSRHATDGSHTIVQANDIIGEIVFKGSDGTNAEFASAITGKVGYLAPGANDMPGKLVFSTTADGAASLTEAMRINQGQGVVVANGGICAMGNNTGTEIADSATNEFNGIVMDYGSPSGAGRHVIRGANNTTIGIYHIRQEAQDNSPGVNTLILDTSNNATFAGTVSDSSDSRLKTNIRTLDSTLSKVMSLRPVVFNRLSQPEDSESTSKEYHGFIAQEVGSLFPDLIHVNPGNVFGEIADLQSIASKEIIPILTKALQEQQVKIERKSGLGDKRLKKYIRPLESSWDVVANLNPIKFQWRSVYKSADTNRSNHFGFLADEIAEHVPELVYTEQPTDDELPENLEHIAYEEMIPILCKVIQELQERVIALEGG